MSPIEQDFDPKRRTVATLGKYTVQLDPLVHLPYGLYRVYRGSRYVGALISHPSESDCEWLERWGDCYATESAKLKRPTNRRGVAPAPRRATT